MEGRNYFLFPLKEAKALVVKNKEKVTVRIYLYCIPISLPQ